MKLTLSLLFLLSYNFLFADEIDTYMSDYKSSGKSDFKTEKYILEKYSLFELIDKLSPFFNDSTGAVRQKAYYFTYKMGLVSELEIQQKVVLKLIDGCHDKNGGIVGNLLSYLQEFPPASFRSDAKNEINILLTKKQIFHFKKLAMLAGITGAGQETMQKKFLNPDIDNETKWILSLALARQGSVKHTNYVMDLVKSTPVNSEIISYIIPDLIYTRQRQAIDYCINIIFSDKKDCYSSNPDKPEFILCAYRIMELLAPIIIDFPYQVDATGSLITNDYEKALIETRSWITNNTTFQILQ